MELPIDLLIYTALKSNDESNEFNAILSITVILLELFVFLLWCNLFFIFLHLLLQKNLAIFS